MKEKPSYKVILWDFNRKTTEFYDVIPFFMEEYERSKSKPATKEEWKKFITSEGRWQFWGRCQYEILVDGFPPSNYQLSEEEYRQFVEKYEKNHTRKYLQEWLFDCIDSRPCNKLDVWSQIEANLPIVVNLLMEYYE